MAAGVIFLRPSDFLWIKMSRGMEALRWANERSAELVNEAVAELGKTLEEGD